MTEIEKLQENGRTPMNPVTEEDFEMTIDLLGLVYRLLDHWKAIVLTAIFCAGLATAYTMYAIVPMYRATSKLYVISNDSAINLSDLQIGSVLTTDYQEVFKTWEVHEMVISNLALPYSYNMMQGMLSVSNPPDTRILYLTVYSPDPKEAAAIANEYATVSKKYISDTFATEQPNILSVALEPTAPVSPNRTRNVMMGFMGGALLVIGIIVLRFLMDDKIKTAEDISKYTGMPTLALVPRIKS